ncbi:biotin/lipoyl-containing protein [Catenisphaera adipataccumulans]|uniref:Biotin carboxyl carrier protein n=1 Tax=Catenisphaera adipataccumulans TaxID=700500 RepID=A0A7W8CXS4_9FIRM|nr:biotin/lipoyl-containing protein [Catenisphaera adipataccumulans]MBB5183568.1 biotin carboxyl carrier protein [Catenisphaera adipataccumulans]
MKYIVTLNGKKYEVEVEKGEATAVYAGPAEPVAPKQNVKQEAPAPKAAAPAAPAGAGDPIKSPMPGTILEVKVSSGQSVKAGDILFILEAMKMENEIVAPKDGTITSVTVAKGAAVETDAVLATIQ